MKSKLLAVFAGLFVLACLIGLPASAQQSTQPIVTSPRPSSFQFLQGGTDGGTSWGPVYLGGDTFVGDGGAGLIYVSGLTGSGGVVSQKANALTWSSALTTPGITQTSTSTTPAANFTIIPQTSSYSGGSVGNFVTAFGSTSGTLPELEVTYGGVLEAALGPFTSSPTANGALWLGNNFTPATNNAALVSSGSTTYLNATSQVVVTTNYGNDLSLWNSSSMQQGVPITFTANQVGGIAPVISQAPTSGATGQNLTFTSQASAATNGTPGNVVLSVPAPTGTGSNGIVQFQNAGSNIGAIAPYGGLIITPANTTGGRILSGYYGAGGPSNTLSLIGMSPTYNMYLGSDINNSYGPAPTTLYYGSGALTGNFNHVFNAINSTSTTTQEIAFGLTGIQVSVPSIYAAPNAAASTAGQALAINGAANTGTGTASTGGALNLTSGSSANGAGGGITIAGGQAGTTSGSGAGGSILIEGGISQGGNNGSVTIQSQSGGGGNGAAQIYLGGANGNTAQVVVSAPMVGQVSAYYVMVNGYATVAVGGASNVLVSTSTAINHYLDLTGALTANINVVLPISQGTEWCVGNLTTGSYTIKLYNGTSASSAPGTAISMVTGSTAAAGAKCTRVWSDGTYLRPAE